MFGWRRRSEGFEWKEYVRTTVLVRRADRQRRMDDARLAALAQVRDVKDRGVEAGKVKISAAKSVASDIAVSIGSQLVIHLQKLCSVLAASAVSASSSLTRVLAEVPMPAIDLPPWIKSGASQALASLPPLRAGNLITSRNALHAAMLAVIVVGGGYMLNTQGSMPVPGAQVSKFAPSTGKADQAVGDIGGRANAVSGELLRVSGTIVRLSGVEAPEGSQPCFKGNGRRWSCGSAATDALNRLTRSKNIDCKLSGTDDAGIPLANCRAGEIDLAAELVRSGHVFAAAGFIQSYANEEASAQAAKSGLWQGDTERPAEWRKRLWEEAKKAAPDGCPIKGIIRTAGRIYAMPWSHNYAGAKLRTVKGERWFCSEDEARAAGFKLSTRS